MKKQRPFFISTGYYFGSAGIHVNQEANLKREKAPLQLFAGASMLFSIIAGALL